jgi:hypothetical protein
MKLINTLCGLNSVTKCYSRWYIYLPLCFKENHYSFVSTAANTEKQTKIRVEAGQVSARQLVDPTNHD